MGVYCVYPTILNTISWNTTQTECFLWPVNYDSVMNNKQGIQRQTYRVVKKHSV